MSSDRDCPPAEAGDARDSARSTGSGSASRPTSAVRWTAALVLLEAVALLAWAAVLAVLTLTGDVSSRPFSAALALTAVAVGVLLRSGAVALRRGRRTARGPLITWQLLQAATATTFVTAGPVATVGSGLAFVLAATVIVLLVAAPRPTPSG